MVASLGPDTGADTPDPTRRSTAGSAAGSTARSTAGSGEDPTQEPVYRAAVVDLLGAVAYGEISAFERMTEDARMAPTLDDKVALLTMANTQFAKVAPVRERLSAMGVDPDRAMAPFHDAFESFHSYTAPADWWESLVKAYVGDGLANDFYREFAGFLDADTRELVVSTLEDGGRADFVVDRVRSGIAADPKLAGRLALWGRRLMGEALAQAQHVAFEREALAELLAGGRIPGFDLARASEIFTRITTRHIERMGSLGLDH